MNWKSIDEQPPDDLVEIMDEHGNTGRAYPTIYPFKIEKGRDKEYPYKVLQCDPYWDGGWLIECEGLDSKINGSIVKWREIE